LVRVVVFVEEEILEDELVGGAPYLVGLVLDE
jgi:hypothetical protein